MSSPMVPGVFGSELTDDFAEKFEAQRRIDAARRSIEGHGMKPAATDPYFGLVPRNSPAGEAIGTGVDTLKDIGNLAGHTAKNLATGGLPDWLMKGAEATKWALTPRGAHRSAAFVDPNEDPRKAKGGPGSPVPLSKPAPGQAADRLSAALGIDASGAVSSAKPPRGRAIDYDPDMAAGTIGFSFGRAPLKVYEPGSDIRSGQFGDSSRAAARGGAVSQSDVEKMPLGQRPESWFTDRDQQRKIEEEDRATKRKIEGEAPSTDPTLGGAGFTKDEAKKPIGAKFEADAATDRAMRTEDNKQKGPERTRKQYQAELDELEKTHQQALSMAKVYPDERMRKQKLAEVEKRHQDRVTQLNTKYGLSERLNARSIYDPAAQ